MEDLTFGEQVKIILGRKGMTIKELAETIEKETGKKMSRQNLTQRLGRDNFQEQDMRLIASILGCPFQLSIMSGEITESAAGRIRKQEVKWNEQEQPEESFSEETVETEKEEQQLTGEVKELKYVKNFVVETADAEIAAAGVKLEYEVGTMIEIPRAALTADEIAKDAEFFCFGTNDLTQMTYGFSRDDAGKFLNAYYDAKIFENDPFAKLDQTGVGKLMEMAIKLGKATRPELHVGICGEHGGDPSSVEFCHKIGLDIPCTDRSFSSSTGSSGRLIAEI